MQFPVQVVCTLFQKHRPSPSCPPPHLQILPKVLPGHPLVAQGNTSDNQGIGKEASSMLPAPPPPVTQSSTSAWLKRNYALMSKFDEQMVRVLQGGLDRSSRNK